MWKTSPQKSHSPWNPSKHPNFPEAPLGPTADGRNPANQLIGSWSPLFTGFYTSQVVQVFFYQQYVSSETQKLRKWQVSKCLGVLPSTELQSQERHRYHVHYWIAHRTESSTSQPWQRPSIPLGSVSRGSGISIIIPMCQIGLENLPNYRFTMILCQICR